MLVISTLGPISRANSLRELFSPCLNSYHNSSKHPLIIVPTKLPRHENLLAEFARFSGVTCLSPFADSFATLCVRAARSCTAEQSEHPSQCCDHRHFTDHGWALRAHHCLHAEHAEQPLQSVQVHFNVHVWTFDAHQLLHNAVPPPVAQKEHPAQSALVHFIVHTVDLGAHQLSHGAATVVAVPVVVLEHGTHAAQRGQVHFVAHGLDL